MLHAYNVSDWQKCGSHVGWSNQTSFEVFVKSPGTKQHMYLLSQWEQKEEHTEVEEHS